MESEDSLIRKCIVSCCPVDQKSQPSTKLYPLPMDTQLSKAWINFIRSTGGVLDRKQVIFKKRRPYVCGLHFSTYSLLKKTRMADVIQLPLPQMKLSALAAKTSVWKLFLQKKGIVPAIKYHRSRKKLTMKNQSFYSKVIKLKKFLKVTLIKTSYAKAKVGRRMVDNMSELICNCNYFTFSHVWI